VQRVEGVRCGIAWLDDVEGDDIDSLDGLAFGGRVELPGESGERLIYRGLLVR